MRQEKARRSKPIQQKIDKAEKEMAELGIRQSEFEAFLAQEEAYSEENKVKLQQTLSELAAVKVKLSELEENWLMWQDEMETVLREIGENLS